MSKEKALKCFAIIWTDKHSVIVDSVHKTKKEAQKKLDWLVGKNSTNNHLYEIKHTVMGTELGKTYRKAQAYDNLMSSSGEAREVIDIIDMLEDETISYKNYDKLEREKYQEKVKSFILTQQTELDELKKAIKDLVNDKTISILPRDGDDSLWKKWNKLKQLCNRGDKE